jgi:hypothetical protein
MGDGRRLTILVWHASLDDTIQHERYLDFLIHS